MIIRKAVNEEYESVRAFYHCIIDGVAGKTDTVGWKKDIYPAPEYLKNSISAGELYIAVEDGEIVASMVLSHDSNDGYQEFRWPTEAAQDEVTVIHALGVHPGRMGQGYGKKMVRFAIDLARKNDQKAIRLDVLKGNTAAERLYTGMGFRYLHTLKMFYEDTGWTDFELYEYVL